MPIDILIIGFIVVGVIFAFRLRGDDARRVAKMYGLAVLLSLGGCVGSLAWLGAETSGNSNPLDGVNPYIWAGLFVAGVVVAVVNSITVIRMRSHAPRDSRDE